MGSPFHWRNPHDDVWQRDIDECERFYKASTRKESGCFPVTGCASFTVNDTSYDPISTSPADHHWRIEAALKTAWTTLMRKNPTLVSRLETCQDGKDRWKRVYSPFRDVDEEKRWLNTTFKAVNLDNQSAMQWFNDETASFDISTVFLVRSKTGEDQFQHTVFLRCPHDVTDGVGVLLLLNQLFKHASQAYDEGERYHLPEKDVEHTTRLSPCLRIAAGILESFSEAQMERFDKIQTRNGSLYHHPGLLGLPPSTPSSARNPGAPSARIQRVQKSLTKSVSERVLRCCKAVAPGVSVTHVFTSALALALAEMQPQEKEPYPVRYVQHSMINLRPYCRRPFGGNDHAAAAYHTISAQALAIDLTVPNKSTSTETEEEKEHVDKLEKELTRIARDVRDFYHNIRSVNEDGDKLAPLTFKAFTPPAGTDTHAVSEAGPAFCPVALSSIGNIASMVTARHGVFELTRVWAASEPIGPGVALFLGCWNGEIELSAVFDARYHDADYVREFLRRIFECACHGLGLGAMVDDGPTPADAASDALAEKRKRKADEDIGVSPKRPQPSPSTSVRSPLRERLSAGNSSPQLLREQDKSKVKKDNIIDGTSRVQVDDV